MVVAHCFSMGIFDFFKRKKQKAETKEKKIINLQDLDNWTNDQLSILKNQKDNFHSIVKDRISNLSTEIEQGTVSLYNIDWDKIKVEERIKQIVKENMSNYSSHLRQLMIELKNLEESNLNKEKIYTMFSAFEKRAGTNYQKSTYLIGKEIEYINKSISLFFKDIDKIHSDNKDLLYKTETLSAIRKNLEELEESDKTIAKIREEINKIEKEANISENELKNHETALNEAKKGAEYTEWKEKTDKFQERKENLKREIQTLQSIIDFKALARIWHENPPEMSVLTEYRSNFHLTFHKEKGEVLTRLINSLENKEAIKDAISKISDLEKEIKNINTENSPSLNLEEEMQKLKEKISSLQERKSAEKKKADKLTLARTPIINTITSDIGTLNIDIAVSLFKYKIGMFLY